MIFNRSLGKLDLFNEIPPLEIEKILSHPAWVEKKVPAGKQIISTGEDLHSLVILIKGQMEGSIMAGDGRQLRLERLDTPSLIAPAFVFGDTPGIVSVRALEDSTILRMNRESFGQMLMVNQNLLFNFLKICSNRFIFLSRKLNLMSFQNIRKKVAIYLLEQMEMRGNPFIMTMTLTNLSEHMGVERPSLSTVFNKMIKENLMQKKGKEVYIYNRERLKQESI